MFYRRLLSRHSESDQIDITQLEYLDGSSKFTSFQVNDLINTLNLQSMSGSFDIKHIREGFEKLDLQGQFNDYRISLPEDGYRIFTDLEFTKLTCPESLFDMGTMASVQSIISFEQSVGNPKPERSEIRLQCSNCNVTLTR